MAFPGTYNFGYYKGDTFEFRVYPKDSSGAAFPLSQYIAPAGLVKFTMAEARGPLSSTQTVVQGYAKISNDNTNILCVITPENGAQLLSGRTYAYDVEISRASAEYDYVYTLLTGTVSVSAEVTQPSSTYLLPDHVDNLAITTAETTSNSITVTWDEATASESYGPASEYKAFILPPTDNPLLILAAYAGGTGNVNTSPITGRTYTFTGLDADTSYILAIIASNDVGDAVISTWTSVELALASGAVLITTTAESP